MWPSLGWTQKHNLWKIQYNIVYSIIVLYIAEICDCFTYKIKLCLDCDSATFFSYVCIFNTQRKCLVWKKKDNLITIITQETSCVDSL